MSVSVKTSTTRLRFLDWTRGLAACIMLQGHVTHSFMKDDLRSGSVYTLSQFLGGLTPALFLFLTGVTLAFLMDSQEKKSLSPFDRVVGVLKRSRYLFMIAFLFRIQLWVFGLPHSPWTTMLKVDILNCMGLAVAVLSFMSVFRTADRVRLCAILGVAIAAASPLVSGMNWTGIPGAIKDYIAPDYLAFPFFPWASFVAFGVSAGSILRLVPKENYGRLMQWSTLAGLVLVTGARYASDLPYSLYSKSEFWLDSPGLILIKLGVMLIIVAFAYLWTQYAVPHKWSWVAQLGTTSLIVYWVHIEMVYGRWLWFWKHNLNEAQSIACAAVLIPMMVGLSVAQTKYKKQAAADKPRNVREAFVTLGRTWQTTVRAWVPSRVSGD